MESTKKSNLELFFANAEAPALYRTIFQAPYHTAPIVGTRGTMVTPSSTPFIWGPACQALSMLFVSAKIAHITEAPIGVPLLEGPSNSPAGSLGRLLKKRPSSWLLDLFGTDAGGRSLLHRLVLLGNARARLEGPVTASLNSQQLHPSHIRIFLDGADVSNNLQALRELSDRLQLSFVPRRDPLAFRPKNPPASTEDLDTRIAA